MTRNKKRDEKKGADEIYKYISHLNNEVREEVLYYNYECMYIGCFVINSN